MSEDSLADGLRTISRIAADLLAELSPDQRAEAADDLNLARGDEVSDRPMFAFAAETFGQAAAIQRAAAPNRRSIRPPLPDPRLIRRIIKQRQLRIRYLDADLIGDPVWDMLLDLTAAHCEHRRVSVTSLCIASGVPPTTALRWIGIMVDSDLCERTPDDIDRRRAFVALSAKGAEIMARLFDDLGSDLVRIF